MSEATTPNPSSPAALPPELAEAAAREAAQLAASRVADAAWPMGAPEDLATAARHASQLCLAALAQAQLHAHCEFEKWPAWADGAWALAWPWQAAKGLRWQLQGGPQSQLSARLADGSEAGLNEVLPLDGVDLSPWRQALLDSAGCLGGKLPLDGPQALFDALPVVVDAPELAAFWGEEESQAESRLGAARAALASASSEAEESNAQTPAPKPVAFWAFWRRWWNRHQHEVHVASQDHLRAAEEGLRQAEARAFASRQAVVEAALRGAAQSELDAKQSTFRRRLGELSDARPQRIWVQGLLPQWPAHVVLSGGPLASDENPLVRVLDAGAWPDAACTPESDAPWLVGPYGDALALTQTSGRELGQIWVLQDIGPEAWAWLIRLGAGVGHLRRARRATHAAQACTQAALLHAQAQVELAWQGVLVCGQAQKPEALDAKLHHRWVSEVLAIAEGAVATVAHAGDRVLRSAQSPEDLVRAVEGLAQADAADLATITHEALLGLARLASRGFEMHGALRAAALDDRIQAARVAAEGLNFMEQAPAALSQLRPPQLPALPAPDADALALLETVAQATRPVDAMWLDALGRKVAELKGGMDAAQADARSQRTQRLRAGMQALRQVVEAQSALWAELLAHAALQMDAPLMAWHAARLDALKLAFTAAHHATGPSPELEAKRLLWDAQLSELAIAEGKLRATAKALGAQMG